MKVRAVAPCYLDEMFHRPGEVFEYDGPPSRAFVKYDEPDPEPGYVEYEKELNDAMNRPGVIERAKEIFGWGSKKE